LIYPLKAGWPIKLIDNLEGKLPVVLYNSFAAIPNQIVPTMQLPANLAKPLLKITPTGYFFYIHYFMIYPGVQRFLSFGYILTNPRQHPAGIRKMHYHIYGRQNYQVLSIL